MNSFFCILLILFASYSEGKTLCNSSNGNDSIYLVKRIKRVGNWYAIYAKNNDKIFKIVTKAPSDKGLSCRIRKGHYYKLELHWTLEKENPRVMNDVDVSCYRYDENTLMCIEPKKGIFRLYYSPNIKSLCYIPFDTN